MRTLSVQAPHWLERAFVCLVGFQLSHLSCAMEPVCSGLSLLCLCYIIEVSHKIRVPRKTSVLLTCKWGIFMIFISLILLYF